MEAAGYRLATPWEDSYDKAGVQRLDAIYVRGLDVRGASIHPTGASDHHGLLANLTLPAPFPSPEEDPMESSIYTTAFWRPSVRSDRRAGALLSIGATSIAVNAFAVDWPQVGGFALGAAALSILTSVGSGIVTGGGPSATNAEVLDA